MNQMKKMKTLIKMSKVIKRHKKKIASALIGSTVVGGGLFLLYKQLAEEKTRLQFIQERLMYINGLLHQTDVTNEILSDVRKNINLILIQSDTVEMFRRNID